jgi:SAM-dependent methyltransferase
MSGARDWYQDGVGDHYRSHGSEYANPHAAIIDTCVRLWVEEVRPDTTSVLDLACGAGELTTALRRAGVVGEFAGIDPYTREAYDKQTGLRCEPMTFEQVANGGLGARHYSLIGCSFAMHLCPASILPALCVELAQRAPMLLILTPHKRPAIRLEWGWELEGERIHQRVRTRWYRSVV